MKIDQESDWDTQKLHITQELSLMNWKNAFHRLGFDQQTIVHQDVETQRFIEYKIFISDWNELLIHRGNVA